MMGSLILMNGKKGSDK